MNDEMALDNGLPDEGLIEVGLPTDDIPGLPSEIDAQDDGASAQNGAGEADDYSKRVQKRINKLTHEKKLEQERTAAAVAAAMELEQRLALVEQRLQQETAERHLGGLSSRLAELKHYKVNLLESGDFQHVAEIDDEILKLNIQQREALAPRRREAPAPQQPPTSRQPQASPPPLPNAQTRWLEDNDWFHNPIKSKQQELANAAYLALVQEEGYDPNDPETYQELDVRLKASAHPSRRKPPPTHAPDRGSAFAGGSVKFTQSDAGKMRLWGLDPNNAEARKVYLTEKAKVANDD